MTDEKILRLPELLAKTGLSRSTMYKMVKEQTFPKPVNLGLRCSGWLQSEVNDWLNQKITQRNEGKPV
ncbi:AlpA family transcriptional regulator [uncultured Draconibacterium sp.]|uniref:helix-turn-helix transcriptional regulator n=1 Tax=uncultured Draconibacterium sp. TaxID=1573823 RepID=UPI0029C68947|nr:AlpA family transcriptional regulator [uncultured Draconibacterium sp.]